MKDVLYDIAMLGYGYYNSGDDAILKSFVDYVQQHHKDLSIMVLSNNPYQTRSCIVSSQFIVFIPLRFPFLSKTRLFITGGGTLIQMAQGRSLLYYLYMIKLAPAGAHTVPLQWVGLYQSVRTVRQHRKF